MDSAEYEATTNHLRGFLSSEGTELPETMKNKGFFKTLLTKYLIIRVNHLSSQQRTKLYNEVQGRLKRFKEIPEMRDKDNVVVQDVKVLKTYLSKCMRIFITHMESTSNINQNGTTDVPLVTNLVIKQSLSDNETRETTTHTTVVPSTSNEATASKKRRRIDETESPDVLEKQRVPVVVQVPTKPNPRKKKPSPKPKMKPRPTPRRRRILSKSSASSRIAVSEIESSEIYTSDKSTTDSSDTSEMSSSEDEVPLRSSSRRISQSPVVLPKVWPVTSDVASSNSEMETNVIETPKTTTSYNVSKFFKAKTSKDNCLSLEGSCAKVCDYLFELNPGTNMLSLSKGSSVEMESRSLFELKELLYWPGVGVKIELPGIAIQRCCESNRQQELIEEANTEIPEDHLNLNKDVVFRYHSTKAVKKVALLQKEVELSHDIIRTYLEAMIKCLSVTNYAKRHEIELVLNILLDDMNKISRSFVNVPYSYYLNDHKYYRVFTQDVELSSNAKLINLREIFNPEIVFKITRCQFQELDNLDMSQMNSYFKAILVDKDPDAIEEFNAMLGKGYTLYCVKCEKNTQQMGQFKCAKRIANMSQHIGPYCVKEFDCVKCGFHSDVLGLAKGLWSHFCEDYKK